MDQLLSKPNVVYTKADQCQYGLRGESGQPQRKGLASPPTAILAAYSHSIGNQVHFTTSEQMFVENERPSSRRNVTR